MHIVFGESLDAGAWPPAPDGRALGFAAVGPAGLLALVETNVGLAGPSVPAARRIAVMRRRIAVLGTSGRFWSGSFEVDPWAVARELLSWRDGLVAAGWTAQALLKPPPRLADLAALEALVDPPLPPGLADRLVAARGAVAGYASLPIERIEVIDPVEAIAPGFKLLIGVLAGKGVKVSYRTIDAGLSSGTSDLARVQAWLKQPHKERLAGDGTFVVLHGHSEVAAAESVAEWLACASETDNTDTVAVLGASTGMLDIALSRRGLPRFARLPSSPLRGAVQVLALAFATRWRPFDPSPLFDLLSLPRSPVPNAVGQALAAALVDAPGRDGPRWREAVEVGVQRRREKFERDGLSGGALDRRAHQDEGRWRAWISGELFDEATGMPAAAAREICAQVAAWSARLAPVAEGPLAAVGGFATTLSLVIDEAGLDPVPRVQLERMIDAVVADGVDADHVLAEAAAWSHVGDPGQVWGPAKNVLWWGCGAVATSRQANIWSDAERSALVKANCWPDDRSASLAREASGWRRAVLNARERVLLIAPPEGGSDAQHPLLHELAPLLSATKAGLTFQSESLFQAKQVSLAGRTISRAACEMRLLPGPRANWSVATGKVRPRETDAATSIERLLGCPFAWAVEYSGKLRPSRRSEVPQGETLLGRLAHALAAEVFQPGQPPPPAEARRLAEKRLPGLIDEIASPLRLPGAAADLARALSRMPTAMEVLAGNLLNLKATVIGAEIERETADALASGLTLKGRVDLLVGLDGGEPAVIDMKWSRSDSYRREDIQAGHAVQLAVYGRILGTAAAPAPGAYFMLSQARLLPAGDNAFGPAPGEGAPSLATVWSNVSTTWKARMDQLRLGQVVATGEALAEGDERPTEELTLELDPDCRFCAKGHLCGQVRVA